MASHSKKGGELNARIAFLDESGISERPSVRRTWAPIGKTPIIFSTGSWKVRSVIGVITCTPAGNNPRLYIRIFPGTIHKEETVRFLIAPEILRPPRHRAGGFFFEWYNFGVCATRLSKI